MSRAEKKALTDHFFLGVLVALGCVYAQDAEVCAEEIVWTVGAASLLRVAKAEDDMCLPDLLKTIRFLRSVGKLGSAKTPRS